MFDLKCNWVGKRAALFGVVSVVLAMAGCGGSSSEKPVFVSNGCSIDQPAQDFQASPGKGFEVAGWAFDKGAAEAASKTQVQLSPVEFKDAKILDAEQGLARADVEKALGVPAAGTSGFKATVGGELLAANTYTITVVRRYPSYTVVCSNVRQLTVK